jgi:SAM-dependent methyltransferase
LPQMVLAQLQNHAQDLICPRCSCPVTVEDDAVWCTRAACPYSKEPFPVIAGVPALLDFEHSIVSADQLVRSSGSAPIPRGMPFSRLKRRLINSVHPPNYQAERNLPRMLGMLRESADTSRRPVVLVVGGGQVGAGVEALYSTDDVDVLAFDIYRSPITQFIADAHRIPLANESVDGVLIQAVLEHVLEPSLVVQEIHRVLRRSGLVYADTPFLQQVHEGPYDFTRFTDSGHRYLFRNFERIDSGVVAGAGTQLAWSVESFFRSLLRSRTAGGIARLALWWLPRLDRFLDPRHSIDGASSVYFLGRKSDTQLSPRDIIAYYQGAQYRSDVATKVQQGTPALRTALAGFKSLHTFMRRIRM